MHGFSGISRFAPTPSGQLHMGSLYLATADYLLAKQNSRLWRLRIDDVDQPRVIKSAMTAIPEALQAHGLLWDDAIYYQSENYHHYDEALKQLISLNKVFVCDCSRKQLIREGHMTDIGIKYPGTCRHQLVSSTDLTQLTGKTLRIIVDNADHHFENQTQQTDTQSTATKAIVWQDEILGRLQNSLSETVGDFVIRRNDGVYSYHLSTTVDEAIMGVTHITRGMDLLDSAPRQIYLQRLLGYAEPAFRHLPLIKHANGQKLAKQHHSLPIEPENAVSNITIVLTWLGLEHTQLQRYQTPETLLKFALEHWDASRPLIEHTI